MTILCESHSGYGTRNTESFWHGEFLILTVPVVPTKMNFRVPVPNHLLSNAQTRRRVAPCCVVSASIEQKENGVLIHFLSQL